LTLYVGPPPFSKMISSSDFAQAAVITVSAARIFLRVLPSSS